MLSYHRSSFCAMRASLAELQTIKAQCDIYIGAVGLYGHVTLIFIVDEEVIVHMSRIMKCLDLNIVLSLVLIFHKN